MNYHFDKAAELAAKRPRRSRLDYGLIPRKLSELAQSGTFYESKVL